MWQYSSRAKCYLTKNHYRFERYHQTCISPITIKSTLVNTTQSALFSPRPKCTYTPQFLPTCTLPSRSNYTSQYSSTRPAWLDRHHRTDTTRPTTPGRHRHDSTRPTRPDQNQQIARGWAGTGRGQVQEDVITKIRTARWYTRRKAGNKERAGYRRKIYWRALDSAQPHLYSGFLACN